MQPLKTMQTSRGDSLGQARAFLSRFRVSITLSTLIAALLFELFYTYYENATSYFRNNTSLFGDGTDLNIIPSSRKANTSPANNSILEATKNATLGFGQIFYISLPQRTDRQDGMELMAKISNITLTLQPGILGTLMDEKAKPKKQGIELLPAQWGCWRSHVDLWRKMVKENIESALIMEDDLDWDVNIHDIMYRLGYQMRTGDLRNSTMTEFEKTNAPYGLDWDTLHLGTCFNSPSSPLPRNITYNDPHSPGRSQLNEVFLWEMEEHWKLPITNSSTFRVIFPAWRPICTISYAITQRGAQRLLYNIGIQPQGDPVDMGIILAIRDGILRSYTVAPPVMTTWKLGSERDSDIDDVEAQKNRHLFMEGSENLRRSARMAMEEMFGGVKMPLTELSDDQRFPKAEEENAVERRKQEEGRKEMGEKKRKR